MFQCSTTCGRGISRQPLVCPASDDNLCGPKPRERRRRCRLRRCQPPSRLTVVCPAMDTTHYCELFNVDDLKRHCQVAPFRKHCCTTCRNIDRFYHSNRFSWKFSRRNIDEDMRNISWKTWIIYTHFIIRLCDSCFKEDIFCQCRAIWLIVSDLVKVTKSKQRV